RTVQSLLSSQSNQPPLVAAWIDWLLKSDWTVRGHDGQRRPIESRDICILFSRFKSFDTDLSQGYADALDARRVPHVLVGTWSFKNRPEIDAITAALTAIEWPDDDLSVYAALRGPLFALPDGLLLRYRSENGRLHPFATVPETLPDDLQPIADGLALLRSLCEARNERPFSDTVHRLLDATRAHVALALRPAGRRALANVQRVVDLARTFEAQGGLSFRGFVEALEHEASQARGHEGPVDEPGAAGVRLMTAYSAKGLEFPVVILADVTAVGARTPNRHVDPSRGLAALKLAGCAPWELRDNMGLERTRDHAESVRLAYVAATRARDLLVVNTLGLSMQTFFSRDGHQRSWIHPLEKVFYPRPILAPARPAPGIPQVGDRTCLSLPLEQRCASPGLHFPADNGPPVVWWDPATLELDVALPFGLRQEHYLAEDESGVQAERGQAQYNEWRRSTAEALDQGNIASLIPFSAADADDDPPEFESFVDEIVLPIAPRRPGGRRFGALVHQILRDTPLDADDASIRAVAKMNGRILDASVQEVEAAADAVHAALGHDLFRRARQAEVCHREWPLLFTNDDGETLDGTLDLVFLEGGQWVVVDYKTDQDPAERIEQYRRHLKWHVHALAMTTECPAYGILLRL
ncbi:MAG: 3'-5' exonuclease, partial [Myxococcota bacterium]